MNKSAIKQKPKPPPYPRPVPKLFVEELPPRLEDVAWSAVNRAGYYSEEDEEGDGGAGDERRAAKRRRVEACAEAYLRGATLQIMTARMTGPINEGWKNPWAKKRRRHQPLAKVEQQNLEIPETMKKLIPSSIDEGKDELPTGTSHREAPPPKSPPRRLDKNANTVLEHAPSPFTSRVQQLPDETSPKVQKQATGRRVQEWLRTNDTFAKTSEVLVHSSPTPARRRHKTPGNSQDDVNAPRQSQSEPPRAPSSKANSARTAVSLRVADSHGLSAAAKRVQKLSKDMQNVIVEPPATLHDDLLNEVQKLTNPSSANSGLDASRAEHAILRAKRGGLRTVPAIAHMSPFEFRKASEHGTKPINGLRGVTDRPLNHGNEQSKADQDSTRGPEDTDIDVVTETFGPGATGLEEDVFATAPQPEEDEQDITEGTGTFSKVRSGDVVEQVPTASASRPAALSTAVSEISTTAMLPSAQPRLEPQQSVSSATHDEKLLSIKPITSNPEVSKERLGDNGEVPPDAGLKAADDVVKSSAPAGGNKDTEKVPDKIDAVSTPLPAHYGVDLNTQEMLADIVPLTMSTVKKARTSTKKESPATATRAKPDRKRKQTSFAVDPSLTSSHGSIKDVMKAKISKRLGSPPSFLVGKDDLDVELVPDENTPQHKRLRRSSSTSKPKGILKSTNPSSSPNSLRKMKAGYLKGQEQEGRYGHKVPIASGQNEVDEDHFDLDAAIDDLGSFLGTWDAEKEASSLDIEL